nr:glycoside hydrolase family 32 protein [Texcoconibacillus texcoconensis]
MKFHELYRPQVHFTPEEMWMNDPNGLVYYRGEYHLFYQYHPFSKQWGPMHWGHAVSTDLLHWTHLPIALYPDELGMIFSGSCVVDYGDTSGFFDGEDGLVAIFTHADQEHQQQSIAYSRDAGRTWEKYEANPVIKNPGVEDFRDPKVLWYEPEQKWVMVLAAGQEVYFYESKNLKDWTYTSSFGDGYGAHGGVWECPDLIELPVDGGPKKKWILQVDIGEGAVAGGSGGQYFIGEFEGKSFVSDHQDVRWLDYGKDFYATQSFANVEGGRCIWLAWMSNWLYANEVPTSPWRSAMSIPREVMLKTDHQGNVILCQEPIRELDCLKASSDASRSFPLFNQEIRSLPQPQGPFEWQLSLDITEANVFKATVFESTEEGVSIVYNKGTGKLYVDRSRRGVRSFSEDFAECYEAPVSCPNEELNLRIIVDTSSIEVFANDGEVVLTNLFFPSPDIKEFRMSLECKEGQQLNVAKQQIQPLKSVWI